MLLQSSGLPGYFDTEEARPDVASKRAVYSSQNRRKAEEDFIIFDTDSKGHSPDIGAAAVNVPNFPSNVIARSNVRFLLGSAYLARKYPIV